MIGTTTPAAMAAVLLLLLQLSPEFLKFIVIHENYMMTTEYTYGECSLYLHSVGIIASCDSVAISLP